MHAHTPSKHTSAINITIITIIGAFVLMMTAFACPGRLFVVMLWLWVHLAFLFQSSFLFLHTSTIEVHPIFVVKETTRNAPLSLTLTHRNWSQVQVRIQSQVPCSIVVRWTLNYYSCLCLPPPPPIDRNRTFVVASFCCRNATRAKSQQHSKRGKPHSVHPVTAQ